MAAADEFTAKTILFIDDDRDLVQALRTVFEGQGYRVLSALDGQAGVEVAVAERPDLVVVDMMMPKKSGFLVIEELKRDTAASPKIIMITANEGGRHRAYAELLGVDDYLCKPFAMEKLLDSVAKLSGT